MKFLFVNPLSGHFKIDPMSMPPLGVLQVAGMLSREGHEVEYVDRNSYLFGALGCVGQPDDAQRAALDRWTRDRISKFGADVVGFTLMTCQLRDTQHCATMVRKLAGQDCMILAGGYHPTTEPQSVFVDIPELDMVIRGQGEFPMLEFASGKPLDQIAGLTFAKKQQQEKKTAWSIITDFGMRRSIQKPLELTMNPDREWRKADCFPALPSRELLDMSYYQRTGDSVINCYYFKTPGSIMTSMGCPKRCTFCASVMMESKLYFRPADQVVDELELMVDHYGTTGVFFYDINFPVHKKRTAEVCRQFIDRGIADKIKWVCCASADNLPHDLLPLMRRAGCVGIVFGFESASQKILDLLNKRTPAQANQDAVDACKANDIRPQSGFIIGVPGEDEGDINMSLDFIAKNDLLSSLNVLLPLPGTPLNTQLRRTGKINPAHPDYWGLISDTNAPLIPERVYSDIAFDRFVDIYNNGMRDVCAPTWKTLYIDQPPGKAPVPGPARMPIAMEMN